ncbi:MAG: AMP-binding enzyme, partial [Actinocrinis sp.]
PARWPRTSNDTVPMGPIHEHLDQMILDGNGEESGEGELCVRGSQRFDGYLDGRDDAGRFVVRGEDAVEVHQRADRVAVEHYFRTGARVRSEHGRLVYLGRVDEQVNVRGYRVEPAEVESALRVHALVDEAAVIAVPCDRDGKSASADEFELVAFYTGDPLDRNAARSWLRKRIPTHMVPRRYVRLDAMPLTVNGQVDRAELRNRLAGDWTAPEPGPDPCPNPGLDAGTGTGTEAGTGTGTGTETETETDTDTDTDAGAGASSAAG